MTRLSLAQREQMAEWVSWLRAQRDYSWTDISLAAGQERGWAKNAYDASFTNCSEENYVALRRYMKRYRNAVDRESPRCNVPHPDLGSAVRCSLDPGHGGDSHEMTSGASRWTWPTAEATTPSTPADDTPQHRVVMPTNNKENTVAKSKKRRPSPSSREVVYASEEELIRAADAVEWMVEHFKKRSNKGFMKAICAATGLSDSGLYRVRQMEPNITRGTAQLCIHTAETLRKAMEDKAAASPTATVAPAATTANAAPLKVEVKQAAARPLPEMWAEEAAAPTQRMRFWIETTVELPIGDIGRIADIVGRARADGDARVVRSEIIND